MSKTKRLNRDHAKKTHFQFWQTLIERKVHFITRIKINAAIEYQQVFTDGYGLRERLVKIGSGTKKTPLVTLGLIEVRVGYSWRSPFNFGA